jgi:hypothetical protein
MTQYRCSWQDYRGWGTSTATKERPPLLHEDFATIDQARARRDQLIAEGLTACVAPTPAPKRARANRHAF